MYFTQRVCLPFVGYFSGIRGFILLGAGSETGTPTRSGHGETAKSAKRDTRTARTHAR